MGPPIRGAILPSVFYVQFNQAAREECERNFLLGVIQDIVLNSLQRSPDARLLKVHEDSVAYLRTVSPVDRRRLVNALVTLGERTTTESFSAVCVALATRYRASVAALVADV